MSGNNDTGRKPEAEVGDGEEATTLRRLIHDALKNVKQVGETSQFDAQLLLGRHLASFEIRFQKVCPNSDPFKCLATHAENEPSLPSYTHRHLRNFAAFARTHDRLECLLKALAARKGRDEDRPPRVSMAHYVATTKTREPKHDKKENLNIPRKLRASMKLRLLRFARQYGWSVRQLNERVNRELGIPVKKPDEFGEAIDMVKIGIGYLTELLLAGEDLTTKQLTALWKLVADMACFSKDVARVAPQGMRDSVLRDAAVLGGHSQIGHPDGAMPDAPAVNVA